MRDILLDELLIFILRIFAKISIFRSEKEAEIVQATLAKNSFEKKMRL